MKKFIPFADFSLDTDSVGLSKGLVKGIVKNGDSYRILGNLSNIVDSHFQVNTSEYPFVSLEVYDDRKYIYTTYGLVRGVGRIYASNGAGGMYALAGGTQVDGYTYGDQWVLWDDGNYYLAGGGWIPKKYPVSAFDGSTTTTNTAGSPPRANTCAKVNDFLVLGGDATNLVPNRVTWSGFNDPEAWTVGADQSDFQDLPVPSLIIKIVPIDNNSAIIFQEKIITRMTYVGVPLIFEFEEIAENIGTLA